MVLLGPPVGMRSGANLRHFLVSNLCSEFEKGEKCEKGEKPETGYYIRRNTKAGAILRFLENLAPACITHLKTRRATRPNPPPSFNSMSYDPPGTLRWPHGVYRAPPSSHRARQRFPGNVSGGALIHSADRGTRDDAPRGVADSK